MSAGTYWKREIQAADKCSPKRGAERRTDRLRSVLRRLDPAVANRAWREYADAVERLINNYSR